MALSRTVTNMLAAVLGVSAMQGPPRAGTYSLGSPIVDEMRETLGGQLQPQTYSQTRWYHADIEAAIREADRGRMAAMARLWRACRSDGVFAGVLSTRTDGLVRLPVIFRGAADIVDALKYGSGESGPSGPQSVFFQMCPPSELAAFACDIIGCQLAVAELIEVEGRDFPVFVRRDPEALVYIWSEDRWYFRSVVGLLPITPGDGKWVLYVGTRVNAWHFGIWRALGRAFVDKDHARNYSSNWQGKLANPARVAEAPEGANEELFNSWFQKVAAWGSNTVFAVKPGYKVSIVESNGIGYQSFEKSIARSEREGTIAIAGQEVTTTGGTGFANADIHKSIRADLIKATADSLAFAINTQVLPLFTVLRFGVERLDDCPVVAWDVTPAKEATAEANTLQTVATAITTLADSLAKFGLKLDVAELCQRFRIPVKGDIDGDGVPDGVANDDGDTDTELDLDEAA